MESFIWTLVAIILAYIFYKYDKSRYFKNLGIPQPFELPFLGSLISFHNLLSGEHVSVVLNKLYNLNKEAKYVGCHVFGMKFIFLRDPDLIKSVLVKNFDHFTDRKSFIDENNDPLFGKNLVFINGDKWREVRNLLSPAFTSSKLRNMFILMSECAENYSEKFMQYYSDDSDIDTKDAFIRYATDVIATCAFGIKVDSLKNPDNEFFLTGSRCANFQNMSIIKIIFLSIFQSLSRKVGVSFISKDDTNYFMNLIKKTIETRNENGISRPDMLQLLLEAQNNKKSDIDLLDITAQAFVFFLGGFESTASQICLIANELALHQNVQRKLQAEIDAVMKESSGKPTYEMVNNNMPYMDAVFNETMRLYPVSNISRMCSKDFELPPALPGCKSYIVKKGEEVWIPSKSIHTDSKYYDDPDTFNPDRFLNKKLTLNDVTYLGFGAGPRACIGNRFAVLETKVMFLYLLAKCDFLLSDKSKNPFEYSRLNFVPNPKNGFWLKIRSRS